MGHFNFKSLAFYGGAVVFVIILFSAVTAYGTANLKAAPAIAGRYRLTLAQNLANCLQSNNLLLTIEQSGIYLNGSLSPAETSPQHSKDHKQKPSLMGELQQQQLNLSGIASSLSVCHSPRVNIRAQVAAKTLQGEIALGGMAGGTRFTAQLKSPSPGVESSSSH